LKRNENEKRKKNENEKKKKRDGGERKKCGGCRNCRTAFDEKRKNDCADFEKQKTNRCRPTPQIDDPLLRRSNKRSPRDVRVSLQLLLPGTMKE
jgi:hypothetical protein